MLKKDQYKQWLGLAATGLLTGFCGSAWGASGFELPFTSASALGTSYAGTAAVAEDASTATSNAAGLTLLKPKEQILVAATGSDTHTHFNVTAIGNTGTTVGSGKIQPYIKGVVPAFHYANKINDQWAAGLSVTIPFGLGVRFKEDSFVRYSATFAQLATYDLAPSLAYNFGNGFSIGAGPDFLFGHLRTKTIVNPIPVPANSLALDGFVEDNMDGQALGAHAGALWEVCESTRLGLNYRSNFKFRAKGEEVGIVAGTGLRQGIKTNLNFPEKVTASFYQALTKKFAVVGDVEWSHWKRFKQIALNYYESGMLEISNELYKDAWIYSLGGIYQFNDRWLLRFGGSYENSPSVDTTRSLTIPIATRISAAVGGQYRIFKNLALDFGYAGSVFRKRVRIQDDPATIVNGPQTMQTATGTAREFAQLLGLQITWDIR